MYVVYVCLINTILTFTFSLYTTHPRVTRNILCVWGLHFVGILRSLYILSFKNVMPGALLG